MSAYGGIQLAGNTTATSVSVAPAILNPTGKWAVIAASQHGNQSVVASAADGKLTLVPGVYKVSLALTCQYGPTGIVRIQVYRGGSAVAGVKAQASTESSATNGAAKTLFCEGIIEITQAQMDASTNYIEPYVYGDQALNPTLFTEGQFLAVKLN